MRKSRFTDEQMVGGMAQNRPNRGAEVISESGAEAKSEPGAYPISESGAEVPRNPPMVH